MVDSRDIALSRRLQDLAAKIDDLVTLELGEPHLGLVIQPWSRDGSCEIAEFQYISNAPNAAMESFAHAINRSPSERA